MYPNCFLKLAGKPNNYQFYLTNLLKLCNNISNGLLRPNQFLENIFEINRAPPCYSMLQHIDRVATPKLVQGNYLRY